MGTRLNLNEINKHLEKKDLDPKLKQSLLDKKDILLKDKIVKKLPKDRKQSCFDYKNPNRFWEMI